RAAAAARRAGSSLTPERAQLGLEDADPLAEPRRVCLRGLQVRVGGGVVLGRHPVRVTPVVAALDGGERQLGQDPLVHRLVALGLEPCPVTDAGHQTRGHRPPSSSIHTAIQPQIASPATSSSTAITATTCATPSSRTGGPCPGARVSTTSRPRRRPRPAGCTTGSTAAGSVWGRPGNPGRRG